MPNENTFSTERLPLAIFLHSTGMLRFLACEPSANGRLQFVFADPEQSGAQAELEYERGASVAATALFASQTYLRRRMSDALNETRNENRKDENRKLEYAYRR